MQRPIQRAQGFEERQGVLKSLARSGVVAHSLPEYGLRYQHLGVLVARSHFLQDACSRLQMSGGSPWRLRR